MEIKKPLHVYVLANKQDSSKGQTVCFIEKKFNEEKGVYEVVMDGTTNEEVLNMLIDRISGLNHDVPFDENIMILENLNAALNWEGVRRRKSERIQAKLRAAMEDQCKKEESDEVPKGKFAGKVLGSMGNERQTPDPNTQEGMGQGNPFPKQGVDPAWPNGGGEAGNVDPMMGQGKPDAPEVEPEDPNGLNDLE